MCWITLPEDLGEVFYFYSGVQAALGAIITITSLAMSTFFQQALDYHTQWTSSGEATVPIAQNMLGKGEGTLFYDNEQVWTDNFDTALQFAPYKAIYSPPRTNFTATATCDTSNCTWQSFETLAVCNTCVNLSSRLDKTRIEVTAPIKAYDVYTNHYTLPNGFGLTGIQPQFVGTEAMYDGVLNMTTSRTANYSVPGEAVVYWDSVAFKDSGSKLISFFVIGPAPNSIPEQPDAAFLPQHSLDMSGSPQFAPPLQRLSVYSSSVSKHVAASLRTGHIRRPSYHAILTTRRDKVHDQQKSGGDHKAMDRHYTSRKRDALYPKRGDFLNDFRALL
ncbi:uncharacterized protein TrAtP1_009152 [Trichoderma atroviride]|uniref:uncharacterized protein n=1 Tax=Hypocrea atroviridis TaxID=63577 RepID=UPI0033222390|nr:hypothetical protein TrAtP1_009152 [Trichoderma atroviride]